MKPITRYAIAALLWGAPNLASAADKPVGLASPTHASTGTVNVATQGFEKAAKPEESDDITQASIGAGGMLTAGNVYSFAANAQLGGKLRRGDVQGEAKLVGNFKHEDAPVSGSATDRAAKLTIGNVQAILRGDYFLAEHVSLFARGSYVYNYILGEDARLNASPGVAIYLIADETQSLHVDIGYDFQRVWLANAPDPDVFHNSRLGLGYSNTLNSSVSFQADLEFLKTLSPWSSLPPSMRTEQLNPAQQQYEKQYRRSNYQLNGFVAVNTKISDRFMFGLTLGFRHDNNPAPLNPNAPNVEQLKKSTDVNTSFNLIYTLF